MNKQSIAEYTNEHDVVFKNFRRFFIAKNKHLKMLVSFHLIFDYHWMGKFSRKILNFYEEFSILEEYSGKI